ncbi:uncharacterized protein EI90DRAFT_2463378 [Cantharellus anzutake]|uniref:uncharacterized protein n=1 Tax=Cantharellus anzutake TaxID=1750568 RepID=UPI0019051A64|nr:uncharacterized protein EI90DRAFT_2463378 [Cantharellus anzutake]KAF8339125.1 hypothetical protein EI90DRAFT_2463378 [Cantharellus anzutake]
MHSYGSIEGLVWESSHSRSRAIDSVRDCRRPGVEYVFSSDGSMVFLSCCGTNRKNQGSSPKDQAYSVYFFLLGGFKVTSPSYGKTARICDVVTREDLRLFQGYFNTVSFSPDGFRIRSASHDQMVPIWDTVTGKNSRSPEMHVSGAGLIQDCFRTPHPAIIRSILGFGNLELDGQNPSFHCLLLYPLRRFHNCLLVRMTESPLFECAGLCATCNNLILGLSRDKQ